MRKEIRRLHVSFFLVNCQRRGPYLLEGARRPVGQAALHQVVPQLAQVQQLVSVVLHRSRNQLCLHADGKHRLHLRALLSLGGGDEQN